MGDPVQFQVHVGEDFAVNIQATREKLRSYVEAMKGTNIFIQYWLWNKSFESMQKGGQERATPEHAQKHRV